MLFRRMPTSLRVLCAVVFVAVMAAWNNAVHFIVGFGYIPGLLLIAGIFWVGYRMENRERRIAGRAAYSADDLRRDFRESVPTFITMGLLVLGAYIVTRFV